MKQTPGVMVVFVTAPDRKVARKLAAAALRARLAACANILPGVQSHYWWEGKLERASEVLILFKTTPRKLKGLEKLILEKHPYDTAEFVSLKVDAGTERYVRWVEESCANRRD